MPQDINQGIFPELVGVGATGNAKVRLITDDCQCMEANLPTDTLPSSDTIVEERHFDQDNHIYSGIANAPMSCKRKPNNSPRQSTVSDLPNSSFNSMLQGSRLKSDETVTDMGNSSIPVYCGLQQSQLDEQNCKDVQFSDMQYKTVGTTASSNLTEDLLCRFDTFFRHRFETELELFRETMGDILSEQQIHLEQIMLKSGCHEQNFTEPEGVRALGEFTIS